jgi:hypothetical protein
MDASSRGDASSAVAQALRRELYWAPAVQRANLARHHGIPLSPLASRWSSLAGALRWEYNEMYPPEPLLRVGRGMRLRMKRLIWRAIRPITRRYDRIAGDLAELGYETAQAIEEARGVERASRAGTPMTGPREPLARGSIAELEAEVEALRMQIRALRTAQGGFEEDPPAETPAS